MITAGDWLLMTWGDFMSYLILAVLAAGLVGLLVGNRVRVRAEQVPSESVVRQRALEQLAARYPVAFTHLLDEETAAVALTQVPAPGLLPPADLTEGGPRG